MSGRYRRLVCNGQRGAEDLGDEGPILSYGFRRLHVTMYADTELSAQDVGLSSIQIAEITRNGIEAGTG